MTSYIPDSAAIVETVEDSGDILSAVGTYLVPALIVVGIGIAVLMMATGIVGWVARVPSDMLKKIKF